MSKSDVISDVLWTEKYRPTRLEDLALEDDNRRVLTEYMSGGAIPHLLLSGPAGSGKTSIARILIAALDCQVLSLNASSERGIDTVRSKIGSFVQSMMLAKWNVVFLDEASEMTADAQQALRNMMESYAERARFILTANYLHKIIAPIQSRCQVLTIGRPPLKERFRVLSKVLQAEGIEATPAIMAGYADRYPDLRAMLFAAQRALLGSANKTLPPASTSGPVSGADLYQWLIGGKKNWTKFLQCTRTGDFDVYQAFRELFWAIPDDYPKAGFLRHIVARGVHETGFAPDPIILFLGLIAEAQEGL